MKRQRRRNQGRPVNGVFLLDKPIGLSSNEALQRVKRIFNAAKAGHTGSLDPLATGMLPICFGEATKFSQFMLEADKVYRTRAKLGVRTASGDSDSDILQTRSVPQLDKEMIETVLQQFRGDIEQVPSMFSALKHQGEPLYKLARQGIEVERKPRPVQIYKFELLDLQNDELELEIYCSKGTYVRTLVDDLGEVLGCGAHVIALRRLSVSGMKPSGMHSLDELEQIAAKTETPEECFRNLDAMLLPIAATVENLPEVELSELMTFYVKQGQPVFVPNTSAQGKVILFNKAADKENRFLGIGEVLDDGRVAPRRLVTTG
ncbi:MAG: tRNA pseudouridine(55) synthase TruB [Pseudomonadales bacterium]|nr:tRNA pseudouridine(55) synthase TruB [Pseudomonadales bacterium]MCP5216078.1 tRNA pseudouridine(55) synthase TruB [Pseudomonadales bacterium]